MQFVNQFLKLKANISFNFVFLILGLSLMIFIPQLRDLVILYSVLLLFAEGYQRGEQTSQTPFLKGALLFIITTLICLLLFSTFNNDITPNIPNQYADVGVFSWVLYLLFVAVTEEQIFRDILPKSMNNLFIPQIMYVLFHFLTISYLVESVNLASMLPFFIFTFIFAVIMMFLTYQFKSVVPAIAVHWVYDLYKLGVLMSVLGWLI